MRVGETQSWRRKKTPWKASRAICVTILLQSGGLRENALVFATDGHLKLLRHWRCLYVFAIKRVRVVLSLYHWIFIQHSDSAFPVVFCLNTRKAAELYNAAWLRTHPNRGPHCPIPHLLWCHDLASVYLTIRVFNQMQRISSWSLTLL